MNKAIVINKLQRRYGPDYALRGVSLSFPKNGLVGIVGHSGSGKTTLLRILAGLDEEYQGSVKVLGKELRKLSQDQRSQLRLHKIGYVFQDYRLLELESVLANVLAPIESIYDAKKPDLRQKALDLLSFVGLEKKAYQRVNTLSGGEKQRVALARSLVCDPKILLADEPTGALDENSGQKVFSLLRGISEHSLVIVITHDQESARRYCDTIIQISGGKIVGKEELEQEEAKRVPKSLLLARRKTKNDIPYGFSFHHAISLIRAKPFRSFISEAAISLGLGALGIVTYVTSSIEKEIKDSLSSLVMQSVVFMECRDENDSPIDNVYSGRVEDAAMLVDEYPDLISDYGTCLALDYENWFVDDNYFSYQAGIDWPILPGFSIRHINDYLWYDPSSGETVFPRPLARMEEDEVILGLPYSTMFSMCLSLHIARNYQSLGDYLLSHSLPIVLHASHIDWGFEDEELFNVVGVISSEMPILYHSDHHWNHKILCDHMGFRSSQVEEVPSPQYVLEIPYLEIIGELEEFRKLCRKDERMARFLWEHVSSSYHPCLCVDGVTSSLKRLFLYSCDKGGVAWHDLDAIMESHKEIEGRSIVSRGGYFSSSEGVMNGFLSKAYLSADKEKILEVSETYADLPISQANYSSSLPSEVADLSYLSPGKTGVRISAAKPVLVSGRNPDGIEECVLSSTLYERWGNPSSVHFALEISAKEIGERYHRDFRFMELKVVGVASGEFSTMYVVSDWTADAPFALLDMSPFVLEPNGALLFLKEGSGGKTLADSLNKEYPKYRFVDPSSEVGSQIASTLDYISVVLYAFSAIALTLSLLLFVITMTLSLAENAHEGRLFFALGFPRTTLSRIPFCQCLLFLGLGTLASLGLVFATQSVVKIYLGNAFGSGVRGSFSFLPFAIVFAVSIVFVFICYIVLHFRALSTKK